MLSSDWVGMKRREIGNAQAWHYPTERAVLLWECYLYDDYRKERAAEDEALATLWRGFEQAILDHSPGTTKILTPSWETIYELADWQEFLSAQGYRQLHLQSFVKDLPPPR